MKHDHSRLALVLIVSGLIWIVAASLFVIYLAGETTQLKRSLIAACERGNQIRHRQNIVIETLDLKIEPLPIIDCEQVVEEGG